MQLWHGVEQVLEFGGGHGLGAGDTIKWVPLANNNCNCCDDADHGGMILDVGPHGGRNVVAIRLPASCDDGGEPGCVYALCMKQAHHDGWLFQSHVTATVTFQPPSPPPSPPPYSPPRAPGVHVTVPVISISKDAGWGRSSLLSWSINIIGEVVYDVCPKVAPLWTCDVRIGKLVIPNDNLLVVMLDCLLVCAACYLLFRLTACICCPPTRDDGHGFERLVDEAGQMPRTPSGWASPDNPRYFIKGSPIRHLKLDLAEEAAVREMALVSHRQGQGTDRSSLASLGNRGGLSSYRSSTPGQESHRGVSFYSGPKSSVYRPPDCAIM